MQKNEINIETVVKIIKKLYWLGLIGIAGSAFDIPILKLFYLFFLLAIIDFILSLIIVLRTEGTDETVNDLKIFISELRYADWNTVHLYTKYVPITKCRYLYAGDSL